MNRDELRERTKQFALRIVRLSASLPKNQIGYFLGRQALRSGTSIGANYREALRASSRKHFASIMDIVLREADETLYWLELISESKLAPAEKLARLIEESGELVAIFAATVKTTRRSPQI